MTKENRVRKSVEQLTIMDDTFFEKMAEDAGFCEEMIATILQQEIKVLSVVPQKSVKNLQGRSVRLDVLCKLENGKLCLVEVQKADDDDHVKRVRYNSSVVTANIVDTGTRFEAVPDVISIFISRFDIFKGNKAIYHIDRVIRETGEVQENGITEIYVNAKVDDGSDIADLMKIFKSESMYDFKKFPKTSHRKKYFKEDERGRQEMCEIVERYAREVALEEAREIAYTLLKDGVDFNLVRKAVKNLSEEELQEIYQGVKKHL